MHLSIYLFWFTNKKKFSCLISSNMKQQLTPNMSYSFTDTPETRFVITPDPAVLGSHLDIECELLQPPSPNIVNYTFRRKRESDLVPELLTSMASNETFDNTSVYIASFSTENATILDYSEYTCKTINLISKKKSSRYLKLDSGL